MNTIQSQKSEDMREAAANAYYVGERFGFGSDEHQEAMRLFQEAKLDYERYCERYELCDYATYNE